MEITTAAGPGPRPQTNNGGDNPGGGPRPTPPGQHPQTNNDGGPRPHPSPPGQHPQTNNGTGNTNGTTTHPTNPGPGPVRPPRDLMEVITGGNGNGTGNGNNGGDSTPPGQSPQADNDGNGQTQGPGQAPGTVRHPQTWWPARIVTTAPATTTGEAGPAANSDPVPRVVNTRTGEAYDGQVVCTNRYDCVVVTPEFMPAEELPPVLKDFGASQSYQQAADDVLFLTQVAAVLRRQTANGTSFITVDLPMRYGAEQYNDRVFNDFIANECGPGGGGLDGLFDCVGNSRFCEEVRKQTIRTCY